ncbi:MAG: phage tail assembly chaperone, partial [Tsuneonella sp.]
PLPTLSRKGRGLLFSASAVTFCSFAARALGWRPHEFWAATPAELAACLADPSAPPAAMDRAQLNRLLEADRDG